MTAAAPRIGFVGAGRIARALARRWHATGQTVVAVCSRHGGSAMQLAAQIEGCVAVASPADVAALADLVVLAVPDDLLAEIAGQLGTLHGKAVVHLSGASELSVLDAARQAGAQVGGLHPLFLFAGRDDDAQRMAGCSITIEAAQPLVETLNQLAHSLGCRPLTIPAGQRALYHAGANYAASFILSLLEEAATLWTHAGIDRAQTVRALWPLVTGTLESAHDRPLSDALAGPVSRGDTGIVARHLEALDALGGDHGVLYRALTRRALELARQRPTATQHSQALAAIAALIDSPNTQD
ncbi:Rossmann-like and DUF2520 domain-containing protein [Uliginosibacterium sp. sgz301328]|uniref:Rossmann-like and DUF2520 domain-containing protein n=1 Tax=Uliginosibacterium sp. sgz301328 TaxID=3243764 RepID=UPI00359D13B2